MKIIIKNFTKRFQKTGLEIFQNFHEILKYFEVRYFLVHLYFEHAKAGKCSGSGSETPTF